MRPRAVLSQAFILAFNHFLSREAWARERLSAHAGCSARIDAAPLRVCFVVDADGRVAEAAVAAPDVDICLAPLPVQLLRGRQAVLQEARITGSAQLAESLGFVLRNLRWDYEEDLSRLLGDIPAHRIGRAVRALGAWHERGVDNLRDNLVEYLRDERPAVTSRRALDRFAASLGALEEALQRLEARVAGIEQRRRARGPARSAG